MKVKFEINCDWPYRQTIETAAGFEYLENAARYLRNSLPEYWLVYRGANHIAIHRASGKPRLAIITE